MKTYISPLTAHVIWHPEYEQGEKFANAIYSTFCRDVSNPLSRGINIPVFFRSMFLKDSHPIEIPYQESDRNALIILVDEKMFGDDSGRKYIRDLAKNKPDNTRLFPVALSQYAYHIDEKVLGKNQFIRADDITGSDATDIFRKQWLILKSRLLHDLSRQLLNLSSFYKVNKYDDPPVKLFLSHAKKDGEILAKQFRDYIESNTKLNTFFDANDIADGHNFEKQIKENAGNSAVIVFQSDEYSNREWCRIEIITAKRFMAPMVYVHDIKKGEKRTFPYMGNAPSIKWSGNMDEIIDLTLLQVLSKYFNAAKLNKYIKLYKLEEKHSCLPLSKPPELFNYIDIEKMKREEKATAKPYLVLYPDPPLGIEELNLLNDIDDKIEFITPILLPSYLK